MRKTAMDALAKLLLVLQLSIMTSAASAALVRYDFEIFDNTPGMEILGEGYFVFDDSIEPNFPGILNDTGLLLDLSFTWNDTEFDETTAMSGFAGFDDDGVVDAFLFGNNCGPGSCGVISGTDDWMIFAGLDVLLGGITFTSSEQPGFFSADIVLSGPSPVPLAPSAVLFLSGLTGLAAVRRRQKRY